MAFPVPAHLPRKPASNDVTSKILTSIDSATRQTITSSLATSWVAELDESIQSTKARIHSRIQEDLPQFQRQLETSKSVQSRLHHLTEEVGVLDDAISNPQTGLVPKTLDTLRKHSKLAQETSDASVASESLAHLLKCRQHYSSVMSLVQFGKLPEAVAASIAMDELVATSPEALQQARRVDTLKTNVEGQLLESIARSLVLHPTELTIERKVPVRNTESTISVDQILASLSQPALNDYLSTLRRDFMANYVDRVLTQPYSVEIKSSLATNSFTLVPAPPNADQRILRLKNLSTIFDFAAQYLFPSLPEPQGKIFLRSLCKPVVTSILNLYLIPQLPSSFGLLPPFLEIVQAAVDFESRYVAKVLDPDSQDFGLRDWANGLSGHYERQRRTAILARSREMLTEKIDLSSTFQADVERTLDSSYPIVVNGSEEEESAWGFEDEAGINTSQTDSWGFEDDAEAEQPPSAAEEPALETSQTDSWGFDDDLEDEPQPEPEQPAPTQAPATTNEDEPDPDEAWGWNDDETLNDVAEAPKEEISQEGKDEPGDEVAWDDDPWADSSTAEFEPEPVVTSPPPPAPAPPKVTAAPKAATRLERVASKNKGQTNGATSPSIPERPAPAKIPAPLLLSQPNSARTVQPSADSAATSMRSSESTAQQQNHQHRPSNIVVSAPAETYRVTTKMKQLVRFVEDVVAESKQFAASNLFAKTASPNGAGGAFTPATPSTTAGATLIQSASSIMDLFQALYPVRFEQELSTIEGALQFSNDCLYLSDSVDKIEREAMNHPELKERLAECRNDLKVLGDSWFNDAVNRECLRNDQMLVDGIQRFAFLGDQDRYDECEEAINKAVSNIKATARRIKAIPSKTKYYQAIGRLVDAALSRVLREIIALPDIPELESNKLSELCRIFNSLEGLFSEDPTQSSFVVAYVPSWLKFSYLSELLEATMADISYLFEQGALVDFEISELVNLVRALFADTQLRTNTINRLMEGHPDSPSV